MVQMQEQQLEAQKGTFTCLYGGAVLPASAPIGRQGQPPKFYTPLPLLPQPVDMDPNELRDDMSHSFKLGQPRLDLGCYLLCLRFKVDIRKMSKQKQQPRDHGGLIEPATVQRGGRWTIARSPPTTAVSAA